MERQGISRKNIIIIIDFDDADPDPTGTHLEFSKMAQIENMKSKYMTVENITTRLKADN